MTNEQIAAMFEEIAELLQLEDANVFRVRSYERAAETIRGLGEELSDIREAGELESIPGIGKALAEKIAEALDTGDMSYRRELGEQYPPGMLEMLRIPGLGPKRAALFYRELEIGSVEDLRGAAESGVIRELKGMGERSEQKLLAAIDAYYQGQERALLGEMLPRAEEMAELLRAMPEVIEADYAGSVRRCKETIGDLDLLAASEEPGQVCAAFAESGLLERVELAGDTKVSGSLPEGRDVDLRVVEPESYGAALVYFTGSQQHNIRLRERGQDRGLKVNEYGVFEEKEGVEGKRIAGRSEKEVYAALDLAWIPPELREDRGEMQAAEADELPELIEPSDIRCDLQMHSTYSDGTHSIEELAEAGRKLGYTHIGITDHSVSLRVAGGLSAEDLARQREEVDAINAGYKKKRRRFRVLLGTEADILADGAVDVTEDGLALVDYVLGSVHQGFSADADKMTSRIIKALQTGLVDIVGHPTGRLLLQRPAYGLHVSDLVDKAAELNVALEINAFPNRLDLSDVNARLAQERGALLSINTDAHHVGHLPYMRYGVATARRGWVVADTVINTWPLERLAKWLQARRGRRKL
jgi:DNA polymerase (family 10)